MGESLLPDVYICLSLNIVLAALALGLRLHGRSIQKVPLCHKLRARPTPAGPPSLRGEGAVLPGTRPGSPRTYLFSRHRRRPVVPARSLLAPLQHQHQRQAVDSDPDGAHGGMAAGAGIQILVAVFQCFPPHYFWDKSIDGKCTVDPAKFFLGSVSTHLVLDVALMILPATQINQLAIPFAQKLAIAGMFMFGIVICIASIMMIVVSLRYDSYAEDIMWNCVPAVNWSAAEIHLSVVACCLPMLRPVIRGVGGWLGHNFASMRGHTGVSSMQLGSVDTSRHDRRVGDSTHNLACDMQNSESNVVYGHGEESDTFTSIRASAERDGYTGVAGKVVMVKHEVNLSFSNKRK
ncbi:hypothetical protein ACJZ2D_012513 [Fusarium nematophilum]